MPPTRSAARRSPQQYSVLDFADAHHRALTAALTAAPVGRQGEVVQAAAEFIRESLSAFEIAARGYHEVQEIARIEHEHVEQLRSLADASVAINSSLTAEEILQLTADAARAVLGARRASIAILSAEPRRPPIGATSPASAGELGPQPVAPQRRPARAGQGPRLARGRRPPRARVLRPRRRDPDAARRPRVGGDRQRPALPARAHDRAHAPALPAPGGAARRARPVGLGALQRGRRGGRARRRLLRPLPRPRRRLGGADRRHPGQGPRGGGGHRARPPHAARGVRLRAPSQRRAHATCTARCASRCPTGASAPSPTPTCRSSRATSGSSWPAAGTRCR